jgi:hypothetical protein
VRPAAGHVELCSRDRLWSDVLNDRDPPAERDHARGLAQEVWPQ